jgi:hypothetical protein
MVKKSWWLLPLGFGWVLSRYRIEMMPYSDHAAIVPRRLGRQAESTPGLTLGLLPRSCASKPAVGADETPCGHSGSQYA